MHRLIRPNCSLVFNNFRLCYRDDNSRFSEVKKCLFSIYMYMYIYTNVKMIDIFVNITSLQCLIIGRTKVFALNYIKNITVLFLLLFFKTTSFSSAHFYFLNFFCLYLNQFYSQYISLSFVTVKKSSSLLFVSD